MCRFALQLHLHLQPQLVFLPLQFQLKKGSKAEASFSHVQLLRFRGRRTIMISRRSSSSVSPPPPSALPRTRPPRIPLPPPPRPPPFAPPRPPPPFPTPAGPPAPPPPFPPPWPRPPLSRPARVPSPPAPRGCTTPLLSFLPGNYSCQGHPRGAIRSGNATERTSAAPSARPAAAPPCLIRLDPGLGCLALFLFRGHLCVPLLLAWPHKAQP